MVESSDGPLEKEMANHFSILALRTSWAVRKGKKIWHWMMNPPRLGCVQYATEKDQRNNSKRNKEAKPKQKQCPVMDMCGDECKAWYCKEQYCIGTWNVWSMNQGKRMWSDSSWQEWTSTFLGNGELKWMRTGEFNSDDHLVYYCGQ